MNSIFSNLFGLKRINGYRKINLSILLSLGIFTTKKVKYYINQILFKSTNENGLILYTKDYNDEEFLENDNENFEKISLKNCTSKDLKLPNMKYAYTTVITPLGYFQYMMVKEKNNIYIDLSSGKSISQYVNPADNLTNILNLKSLKKDYSQKFIEF